MLIIETVLAPKIYLDIVCASLLQPMMKTMVYEGVSGKRGGDQCGGVSDVR